MERVELVADGITLVGDLRVPSPGGRAPGLVFTGPFTGVRDQVTGLYAGRLAAAGGHLTEALTSGLRSHAEAAPGISAVTTPGSARRASQPITLRNHLR